MSGGQLGAPAAVKTAGPSRGEGAPAREGSEGIHRWHARAFAGENEACRRKGGRGKGAFGAREGGGRADVLEVSFS